MGRGTSIFAHLLVLALCLCALALCIWLPMRASLQYRIADTRISLDTSRQRETKQTYEYNQVAEALPLARTELEELQPRADDAVAQDQAMRAERKQLRADIKALKEELESLKTSGETEAQP